MPRNTTVSEQVALINRLGCIRRAMVAEFRLSRLRYAEDKKKQQGKKKGA